MSAKEIKYDIKAREAMLRGVRYPGRTPSRSPWGPKAAT